ncbi:MAG: ABC transporter permease [Bryobacteraceae bacterium]
MDWRRKRDDDLNRELEAHLELEAEEQREAGLAPEDSRAAARRAFGNVGCVKEDVRRAWGWTRLEAMLLDFRYALRGLRKNPGFAFTAILTLGVAIGASTAVFTVVDSVILKSLAYEDSGRLVAVWEHAASIGGGAVGPNPRHTDYWAQRSNAFDGLTWCRQVVAGVALGTEPPRPVGAVYVHPNLFQVLRARPTLGRDFLPGEGKEGTPSVAILTHGAWKSLFAGDPGAVGKVIRTNGEPHEVVGVLPESFHFPGSNTLRAYRSGQQRSELSEPWMFVPIVFNMAEMEWNGNFGNFVTLGRLARGVSINAATAQLNAIQDRLSREIPGGANNRPGSLRASLQPMHEAVVGDSGQGIWLLMAAVAGLLLLACLNLANAQLGRALAAARDSGIRAALGAAKWRLLWRAVAENLLLSGIGGALGVVFAYAGLEFFRSHSPIDLPRLAEVRLNPAALLFSLAATIGAGMAAGLLPGIHGAASSHASLQAGARAAGSRTSHRLRRWLIGAQVCGCTLLLLMTGLFARSLLHLVRQEKGLVTARTAIAEVRLMPSFFKGPEQRIELIDGVLRTLRASPGVESAAYFSAMPFEGESWIEFARRPERRGDDVPMVNARWVSPGYFESTGQRLIAGRFFEERDRNLDSIVLSEAEAKVLWGDADPIGGAVNALGRDFTVIGVVADSRNVSLKAPPPKMIYIHYSYRPPGQTFFIARGTHAAGALPSILRDAIAKQSPHVTIARAKTLDSQLTDSLSPERFQTFVLIGFGASALLLAMLGIYGVLSYSVALRKQEIGVRMALGATKRSVYGLTMREAGAPVAAGLALGLGASVWSARIVENLLYGTKRVDFPVIALVLLLIAAAALAAAFVPARHAASIDPMDALRPD